jgi:putative hemolysin
MDPDERLLELLLLLALLLASGYFVAAEFAVLTLRRRKVEEIAREPGATRNAAPPTEDLSLAAQLGSSATALVLGYLAAQYALSILTRVPPAVAVLIGLLVATLLHLVVGEQIPRLLGSQRAAWFGSGPALLPLRVLSLLLRPLIAVLSSALEAISRSLQLSRSTLYSPVYTLEDIRSLVTSGHQQGVVEVEEREMIDGVLELSETVAREVMTPRIDIVAVPLDVDLERLVQLVVAEGHSRLPVYRNSIDNIVGVLLAKDLLPLLTHGAEFDDATFDVVRLMREPFFVPDTKPISEILGEFRRTSVHLAIVLDEFGGTYGLVTLEDLLEEIVGEIRDEHDLEEPEFARTPDGDVLIDGGASISEVNERFGLHIPEEDFDTIGGYIFGALGRVPEPGDRVDGVGDDPGVALDVEETEDRRITRVRLRRTGSVVAPER